MDKFKSMTELKELTKEGKDWEIECENRSKHSHYISITWRWN